MSYIGRLDPKSPVPRAVSRVHQVVFQDQRPVLLEGRQIGIVGRLRQGDQHVEARGGQLEYLVLGYDDVASAAAAS